MMVFGVIVALSVGFGIAMVDHHSNQESRRESVLTPLEPGNLATVKNYIVLRTRGRTVEEIANQFDVQATMEEVVSFITRAVPRDLREAAKKLCERELKRTERARG